METRDNSHNLVIKIFLSPLFYPFYSFVGRFRPFVFWNLDSFRLRESGMIALCVNVLQDVIRCGVLLGCLFC